MVKMCRNWHTYVVVFGAIFGLFPSSDGVPFVNKRIQGVPRRMTNRELAGAKNPPPDQPLDPRKIIRPDLFEGDIAGISRNTMRDAMYAAKSRDFLFVRRTALRNRYNLWSGGRIPYVVSSNYYDIALFKLAAALKDFHRNTCVRFVPRSGEEDYIYFRPHDGCYSLVGKIGGQQTVSLDEGCFQHGTIVHEIMHALGIFHEQNRNDRDNYVAIKYENIIPGLENNFEKRPAETIDHLGTPYDYGSVMHYGPLYFSRNGLPTVVPYKSGVEIGQREGFSPLDIDRINKLYNCYPLISQPPLRPKPEPRSRPKPLPGLPPSPSGRQGPRGGACFQKIPGAPIMVKVKRGCYRVVKYDGRITVASCNFLGDSTKMVTRFEEDAREEAREHQKRGLRQCYTEGLRRRGGPRPGLYAHETDWKPDWRFDKVTERRRHKGPAHVIHRTSGRRNNRNRRVNREG